jgi:hypothetical protein
MKSSSVTNNRRNKETKVKIGNYKIPFDKDGNQLEYEMSYRGQQPVMIDNHTFEDELTFYTYGRGRSSVTFTFFRGSNGKYVSMFVSDFSKIIPLLADGKIKGTFTFTKKGANYGCKWIAG